MTQSPQDAIDLACREPTLIKALAFIALWECERVVSQAHKHLSKQTPDHLGEQGWDTFFEYLIKEVMEQYTINRLKGV
jgi:hypothetical protein